jgi:hypothetical protein
LRLLIEKQADDWRISKAGGALEGEQSTAQRHLTRNVGFYFLGENVKRVDLLRKELAADALQYDPNFFNALGSAICNCSKAGEDRFSIELEEGDRADEFKRLLRRACSTRSDQTRQLKLLIQLLASASVALAMFLWSVLRYGDSRRHKVSNRIWLAAYPEWTNRTRHLLSLAANRREVLPLIVLGRPKSSIREFEQELKAKLPDGRFQLIRPLNLRALMHSIPAVAAELRRAARDLGKLGYCPPPRRLAGILYRLCLGQVHRSWWRQARCDGRLVIYGHTGNADTSALEEEQQRAGLKTVHLFHGISTGHTYTGLSTVAIARCAHDVRWHCDLGGYEQVVSFAAPVPPLAHGGGRWAFLTNYAHPTAFSDEAVAVAFEISAIRCVAAAAAQLGQAHDQIFYRPHPALDMLSEVARQRVREAAREAGLSTWPVSRDLASLSSFELVLTTPSTIVQDALLAGALPVVVDMAGVDADSVYGAYPFCGGSQSQLASVIREVRADREGSFRRAWEAVGPGLIPDLREIERIADSAG